MNRYEILVLAVPEITQDEAKHIESQTDRLIKAVKGTTISFDRWGKYRLAYPVKKNDYGIYFLSRFEVDTKASGALIKELHELFAVKFNDVVMRDMVTRLEDEGSLEYNRPQSLEEAPAKDVQSFLRDNKMGGLLNASEAKAKRGGEEFEAGEDFDSEDDE
jgi:small subunit ribosomal protein S6